MRKEHSVNMCVCLHLFGTLLPLTALDFTWWVGREYRGNASVSMFIHLHFFGTSVTCAPVEGFAIVSANKLQTVQPCMPLIHALHLGPCMPQVARLVMM